MAADSVPLTTPDRLSPESVVGATFTTGFRGFDQDEVRAYLHRLAELLQAAETREAELRSQLEAAEQRAAKPGPLDEEQVASVLGEEAARILVTARQAAGDIRRKAEESAATLVREAQDEANRIRQEADGIRQERTTEAEAAAASIRQAAEAEATRKLTDAERRLAEAVVEVEQIRLDASDDAARTRSEAENEASEIREDAREAGRLEVEEARRLARESVAEAQVVRERVLADLARKRKAARVHLEQLRAGRDRLLSAYDVVRRTLAEATGELENVLLEAKHAAGAAARRVENEDDSAEILEAELAAGRLVGLPLLEDHDADVEVTGGPQPDEAAVAETAPAPEPAPAVEPIHLPPRRDRKGLFRHRRSSAGDQLPEADLFPVAPNDPVEEVKVVKPPEPAADDATHELDVHELFERLKAETETQTEEPETSEPGQPEASEPEADAASTDAPEAPAEGQESADTVDARSAEPEPEPEDPDAPLLQRRDAELDAIEQRLARRLKRVLADEQNEVLDRLRRLGPGPVEVGALLPPAEGHAAPYADAASEELAAAAGAGRAFLGGNGSSAPVVDDLAGELSVSITERIRERVASVVHDTEGDEDALTDGVRACYREWKSRHLSEATRNITVAAFSRGVYDAVAPEAAIKWVGDDDGPPCPDCEDNALAASMTKETPFPTGHRHPPAHPGCRCLVVPTDTSSG